MTTFNTPEKINSSSRKIHWLASYPKSGNTWVRVFLDAYATGYPINLNSAFKFVSTDIDPIIFQMMMPRSVSELTLTEQFMYHNGALLNLIKCAKTKNIVVKTHNAKAFVEGVTLIPPSISDKSIYIIRDPRDVCISAAYHFNIAISDMIPFMADSGRIGESEHNLYHLFMSWTDNVFSWTIKNKDIPVTIIKYEKLITKTKQTFKLILEALDIRYDEQRFDFALNQSSFSNLQQQEKSQSFSERRGPENFFRVGKMNQWKEVLTKDQIDRIEKDHREMMQHYGYV
jgi:hypothetical protein